MNRLLPIVLIFLAACSPAKDDPLTLSQRKWLTEHGTVVVGMFKDYPPFGYITASGNVEGFSVDLWRLLARKLNMRVELRPSSFSDQLYGLRTGAFDSLAGIFPIKERERWFAFSSTYFHLNCAAFVKTSDTASTSLSELRGKKHVFAVEGDAAVAEAQRFGVKPTLVRDFSEAIDRFLQHEGGGLVMDVPTAMHYLREKDVEDEVRMLPNPVSSGQLTLPVRKGNRVLLSILNSGLSMITMQEWQSLCQKWRVVIPGLAIPESHLTHEGLLPQPAKVSKSS